MKKVLCFGDSNTFGFNPENGFRFSKDIRWTGVLQKLCDSEFEITEAGCNNRTCFRNNPEGKKFTGYQILPEYLTADLDIVILAIGTNDLQRIYPKASIQEIQYGIENLVRITKAGAPSAEIILISPSKIGKEVLKSGIFAFLFDEISVEKSTLFSEIYQEVANKENCKFLDLAPIKPSPIDGLHYDAEAHGQIAKLIYDIIK